MELVQKNICFVATIRNCAPFLTPIFQNIDQLLQFHHVSCIFVYDNCKDNTAQLLYEYQSKSNHRVVIEELVNNKSPLRTVRIANGRNRCLELLEQDSNCEFFIMLDMDDVNKNPWNIDIINKYLHNFDNDDWDAISFNRTPYYDIWALMIDDYKHHVWGFGNHSPLLVKHMKKYISIKLQISETNSIFCNSAFNGFSIYRTSKFRNIRYNGKYSDFVDANFINEHQRQLCLQKYQTFYSNPGIVMKQCRFPFLDPDEHCEHLYFHNMAIVQNQCKIKISKFSIF